MKLKVIVDDLTFFINVGQGLCDFAWLALIAAKLYSKQKNPNSNYLPSFLQIKTAETDFFFTPHPRTRIFDFFKDDGQEMDENQMIQVTIKRGNLPQSVEQEKWFDQAFGSQRNLMHCEFKMFTENSKIAKRREAQFVVMINYKMFPEIAYEFNARDYKSIFEIPLKEHEVAENILEYHAEITLPFGDVTAQLCAYLKSDRPEDEGQRQKTTLDHKINNFSYDRTPAPLSQAEVQKKIRESIKVPEQLSLQLEQQELDNKKEKQPPNLCPYSFETLWGVIENNPDGNLNLENLDDNLREKIEPLLNETLYKLYEVFFQYTLLYLQQTDKKDEICITLQDVMHFLKFYELIQDSQSLFQFIEFYDADGKRTNDFKNSIDLNSGIKFPEFIVIIIKLAQFHLTINLMAEGETQDKTIANLVEKIISIDSREDALNEFQKHMKYNITLINFLRENSEKLQLVYVLKLQDSIQVVDKKGHMLKEEVKSLIQEAGFKGDNLDEIIDTCYKELFNDDKYQGFEGIFFYEFLQVLNYIYFGSTMALFGVDCRQRRRREGVTGGHRGRC